MDQEVVLEMIHLKENKVIQAYQASREWRASLVLMALQVQMADLEEMDSLEGKVR